NVGPKRFAVTAQPVVPGDPDYSRLLAIVNNMKNNKNRYIGYQKKTSRPIPVVRLTPSDDASRLLPDRESKMGIDDL
ncbi:MAG: nitroreductase/quinone reductase family protein, partial [Mycobacterium sp.]